MRSTHENVLAEDALAAHNIAAGNQTPAPILKLGDRERPAVELPRLRLWSARGGSTQGGAPRRKVFCQMASRPCQMASRRDAMPASDASILRRHLGCFECVLLFLRSEVSRVLGVSDAAGLRVRLALRNPTPRRSSCANIVCSVSESRRCHGGDSIWRRWRSRCLHQSWC